MTDTYDQAQLKELLLQMVETELGGEQVYLQALESVVNDDLRKEWQGYLEETLRHQGILRRVCDALDIDESEQSPGRQHFSVWAMRRMRKSCTCRAVASG